MVNKPSIIRIILTDYAAFLATIFLPIFWAGYFLLITEDAKTPQWMILTFVGGITLVCLAVIVWRINLIETIFEDGWETQATITQVTFNKDRGRVDYKYTYDGIDYESGNAVMKTPWTTALRFGEMVTVLVDRNRPNRAYLRNLYLSKPDLAVALLKPVDAPGTCITFQGTFDKKLLFKTLALAYRPSKWMVLWWIGLMVFLVGIAAVIIYSSQETQINPYQWFRYIAYPILAAIVGLLASYEAAIAAYFPSRNWWKTLDQQPLVVGEVDWEGIRYAVHSGEALFVPWSKFVKIRVDKQMLAMVTGDGTVHALSRSFFQTKIEWVLSAALAKYLVRSAPYA